MIHTIEGFDLSLDTTNPETPKFISPVTGDGQRASYTDVLLMLLIERMDKLIEAQPKQDGKIVRELKADESKSTSEQSKAEGDRTEPGVKRSSSRLKKPAGEAD